VLSSTAARWGKEILLAFTCSFVNPIAIAINFLFVFERLAISDGANIFVIPGYLVPVYVATGMVVYAVITSIVFLVVRFMFELSFSRFSSVNAFAHLAFAPFLLLSTQLVLGGMEWNVMGFIVVPLFLLASFFCIPGSIAIAMMRLNKQRRN